MSDTPQGPGWWLASDGRWYAPEHTPQPGERVGGPESSPTYGIDHATGLDDGARPEPPGAIGADPARVTGGAATGTQARPEPDPGPEPAPVEAWEFTDPEESDIPTQRNVWPLVGGAFAVSAVLVVLVAIALALLDGAADDAGTEATATTEERTDITSVVIGEDDDGGSECEAGSDDPDDTRNLCLYPDRPDRRRSDHEAALGDSVRIDDVEVTASTVRAATNPSGEEVMVVDVELRNVGAANHEYNLFDWHLMTTDGEVVEPFGVPPADAAELASDSLPRGDTVTGTVTFGSRTVPSYIVYQPRLVDDGRGIWLAEE